MGDYPIEYKVLAGIAIPATATLLTAMVAYTVDGLVDIYKGTHHYFIPKVVRTLTKNQKRREKIDKELNEQLENLEKPIN